MASPKRLSAAPDPMIGQVLDGRYRVLSRLGGGGMGVVYEAEHTLIGRRVAVKLMAHAARVEDEYVARFQREAMAAASIGHPHIVDVIDMGTCEPGGAYLVLELLAGRELGRAVAEDGPFSVARAVHIALQLCDALSAVHAKRIVHRDLKPENLMLLRDRQGEDFVKVLDFGVCKLLSARAGDEQLTHSQASIGTPQYMAPEQFRGSARVDERADIYAVGAILYFMLTGHAPFEADDMMLLLLRVCTEAPPSARHRAPGVPVDLDLAIKRACAKRPDERFSTAHELSAALAPFGRLSSGRKTQPEAVVFPVAAGSAAESARAPTALSLAPSGSRPVRAQRPWLDWGGAALVALAGVGGAVWLLSHSALGRVDASHATLTPPPLPTASSARAEEAVAEGSVTRPEEPEPALVSPSAGRRPGAPARNPTTAREVSRLVRSLPNKAPDGPVTAHGDGPRDAPPEPGEVHAREEAAAPAPPQPEDELARYRLPARQIRDVR